MYEAIGVLRRKMRMADAKRVLIGLSGGADSVALLMALLPDILDGRLQAEAVHVNHGLRGSASEGDEQFCRKLCEREGIRLTVYRAELNGRKDEASAREARYAAFRSRYAEYGADALALAHHADDQAETFLMRLLRGAGPDGLACMKEEETSGDIRILRPMLSLRREEIRAALRADGIAWREDESNLDPSFLRNRIRLELIPAMNRISGTAVEKICAAAALSGEDNRTLYTQACGILNRISTGRVLNAQALAEVPSALRRRVLRLWWQDQGPALKEHALSMAQTEAFERLLFADKGKINLPGEMHAVRNGKYLFLTGREAPPPEAVRVTGSETVFGSYRLTETASEENPGDGKRTQEVPEGFTDGCVVRTRQPGDIIRPFGSSGSRKLQDYLTDRRIAEPFRDRIPLLCRDREVLLVCGVGAGNIPRRTPNTPSVRLTWHGEMPWNE